MGSGLLSISTGNGTIKKSMRASYLNRGESSCNIGLPDEVFSIDIINIEKVGMHLFLQSN
jgi:hypothetical protein